ncbi:MAG: hypothetical protein ACRDU9_07480, partial [Acidimicrobiia bacterium]
MPTDLRCEQIQLELSIAHDEGRLPDAVARAHLLDCGECSAFSQGLPSLDLVMSAGEFTRAPDLAPRVIDKLTAPRRQWWSVAAVALVGLVVGALVGGVGTRLDTGRAQDLGDLFHTAGTNLEGLSAELVVVERGLHPDVPERVYSGSIAYDAPEQLTIELVDTTSYPDESWRPNDVYLTISDGDTLSIAGSPCPVAALPVCLVEPSMRALSDLPPFDDGVLLPLEIVGPGRSLTWSSGIQVVGTTSLG